MDFSSFFAGVPGFLQGAFGAYSTIAARKSSDKANELSAKVAIAQANAEAAKAGAAAPMPVAPASGFPVPVLIGGLAAVVILVVLVRR